MKTRVLSVLMGLFLCAAPAFAQQKNVTGKVTDEAGSPLQGASVVIKGTTTGTVTNGSGDYAIRVAPGQILTIATSAPCPPSGRSVQRT